MDLNARLNAIRNPSQPSVSPRLLHLTVTSQLSILSSFASTATTLQYLRRFVSTVFNKASQRPASEDRVSYIINFRRRNSRTLEAFADAVDFEIRSFDKWCSSKEEDICRAHAGLGDALVVTFLSLEKSIRDKFASTLVVLTEVLGKVMQKASSRRQYHTYVNPASPGPIWNLTEIQSHVPPSIITSILLNTLLQAVQEKSSMGDIVTSDGLMRVFAKTAEPVWSMMGTWLKNGMPIHDLATATVPSAGTTYGDAGTVDDEFFVEDNEIGLLDPDFWVEGYKLRDTVGEDGDGSQSIPIFIGHVADAVLSAGKAIGLLRALGDPHLFGDQGQQIGIPTWKRFGSLIEASNEHNTTSADVLSRLVHDELHPHCLSAQGILKNVLVEDCDLWLHVHAIEDCYLMRRGDAMSHFLDKLFNKVGIVEN